MYAGDEVHGDEETSGPLPPERTCEVCTECGAACAKTDEGLCWECSTEIGGEA